MVDLSQYFDTSQRYENDNDGEFLSLDSGRYTVRCEDVEEETFNNNVSIKFKLRILGPSGINRVIFPSCLVAHSNSTAQNIGRSFMQTMRDAIGQPDLSNTDGFRNEQFDIMVVKKNIADLKDPDHCRESASGKRYVFGKAVDSNGDYNEFPRCLAYEGESMPASNSAAPAKKDNKELPPFLRKG